MKKLLALVFALIAIGHVYANEFEPKSPVGIAVVKSGDIVKLFYRGEQTGKVKVTIYNAKGHAVFVETMNKTEHFMRPYNFSSLPEGDYTFELTDAKGIRFQKVTHSYSPNTSSTYTRPGHLSRLNRFENKYLLTVPNRGRESLSVKIFDDRNTLLYEGTEVMDGDFAKVYNLNGIEGEHTFEIVDQSGKANRFIKPTSSK